MDGVASLPSVFRVHGVAPDFGMIGGVTAVVVVAESKAGLVLNGGGVCVGRLFGPSLALGT